MSSLRRAIRKWVPFSTGLYEFQEHQRRLAGSRTRLKTLRSSGEEILLDLGGGESRGSGPWITVDVIQGCDLYWDLRRGIPFADNKVSRIYSSHMFEHLTYQEGQVLLDECMRTLMPGGSISIAVPNARIYVESYLGLRELDDEYFGWEPAYNRTTRIDALNYVAHMAGEHKYMFDQENLLHLLNAKGFINVSARPFDPETDMQERDYESIYAIGYKPA